MSGRHERLARGEVVIDEALCKGCGLCVDFCTRGCIEIAPDKVSVRGLPLATFAAPEKCNACGVCGWMCPDFAIEVYKYVKAPATS